MNLVFFCQSCGSRFEVEARHAGRSARCRKCGQKAVVPRPAELASMVAMPVASPSPGAVATATKAAPRPKASAAAAARSASWIRAASSSVALAPITDSALPRLMRAGAKPASGPMDNWDDDDSKPYALAPRPSAPPKAPPLGKPVGAVKRLYRREMGTVQNVLRWLNETAYVISVPFVMVIIFGAIVQSRNVALFGATVVVLLNAGRFVVGLGNILAVPFRDGPVKGLLFLVPPFTVFYLLNHWDKLKKPTKRVVGPAVTVAAVVMAFSFLPTLRGDAAADSKDMLGKLRAGASDISGEVRGQVERAESAGAAGALDALGEKARSGLRRLQEKAGSGGDAEAPARPGPTPP